MEQVPLVALVGAGPGDPDLLTLRAVELLHQADLVLYDQLVPPRLLEHAPQAEHLCVTQLPGCHPERYAAIHETMITAARAGKRVVRLKGGDPLIFGRGGEEGEILTAAGIPFEIVPGVTSGLGAAAYAGIPLTHRHHASAVAFITGHEDPTKESSSLDWATLGRFPGTLVFYMGLGHLDRILQALITHGMAPTTPGAVIHAATRPEQRVVEGPLDNLAARVLAAGLTSPSLVVIGSVVQLRPVLNWFEKRPLFGRRVLVTRPAHQAISFVRDLEHQGASVLTLPTVAVGPPADWTPVDHALARLRDYQWLVFTSVNGVHALLSRLRAGGRDLRALGHVRLAVIGPATADALRGYHLEPDLIPPEFCSESLAAVLKTQAREQRLLLARADRGRDLLREELATCAVVDQVAVYSQVDAVDAEAESLARLNRGEVDYLTLTSANIARALARAVSPDGHKAIRTGQTRIVTISPVTSAAVRELGWPVAGEARVYTLPGVLHALIDLNRMGPVRTRG